MSGGGPASSTFVKSQYPCPGMAPVTLCDIPRAPSWPAAGIVEGSELLQSVVTGPVGAKQQAVLGDLHRAGDHASPDLAGVAVADAAADSREAHRATPIDLAQDLTSGSGRCRMRRPGSPVSGIRAARSSNETRPCSMGATNGAWARGRPSWSASIFTRRSSCRSVRTPSTACALRRSRRDKRPIEPEMGGGLSSPRTPAPGDPLDLPHRHEWSPGERTAKFLIARGEGIWFTHPSCQVVSR